ncbi:hypothetical protein N9D23_14170, partial [Rubripirellula sp.]|nr:hypothetical protein [Rubripirellula sp.]
MRYTNKISRRTLWMVPCMLLFASFGLALGCNSTNEDELLPVPQGEEAGDSSFPRSKQDRFGTRFYDASSKYRRTPKLTELALPSVPHANAIWGATGRDDLGNVYLGVFCDYGERPSATLCRIVAGGNVATILGDANSNLDRIAFAAGESQQAKIHGKPVQANDGFLYFASMDEAGEKEDGSAFPTWGSHLWRIDPLGDGSYWEHVLHVPHALIATACTGRYVYALGYFDHVVYQYDSEKSTTRVKTIGAAGGHVSRNFLVDLNEHCYIPRLTRSTNGSLREAELVELDPQLNEVTTHPLPEYGGTGDSKSHGIVSFVTLRDGDMLFVTAPGAMYRLHPDSTSGSKLERLGWVHPDGTSYAACLICPDGESVVCSLARRPNSVFQWVINDVQAKTAEVMDFDEHATALLERPSTLLYGSNTMDNQGNAYLVGRFKGMSDSLLKL